MVAAGVHALWTLRNEAHAAAASDQQHTIVAYNGSVIEHYPHFKETCQQHLDELALASGAETGAIELMYAEESSLLGAAVAVACLDG
jgi:hexokinase